MNSKLPINSETNSPVYWSIIVTLTCLIVNPVGSGDWALALPKLIFLLSSTFITIILAVFHRKIKLQSKLSLLIPIYLILALLSNTVFSESPATTLTGWPGWFGGYIFHALLGIIAFMTINYKSDQINFEKNFRYMLHIIIGLGAILSIISCLEMLGFNPVLGNSLLSYTGYKVSLSDPSYPIATIGNSGVIAGILLLILPLVYIIKNKICLLFFSNLIASGLAATHSKTSIILGLFIFLCSLLINKKIPKLVILTNIACIFLSLPAISYSNAILVKNGIHVRTVQPPNMLDKGNYSTSLSGRILIYKGTSKMILKRPYFGWGYETLQLGLYSNLASQEYKDLIAPVIGLKENEILRRKGDFHIVFSKDKNRVLRMKYFSFIKPHNYILEEMYSNGIPATLTLLMFLGISAFKLISSKNHLILLSLLGLFSYFIYLQMWFTSLSVTPLAACLLGFSICYAYHLKRNPENEVENYKSSL